MRMARFALILFLAISLLMPIACTPGKYAQIQNQLKQNQELWASQKIANYSYTLQTLCFCPPDITQPVVIEVRNGASVSITPVDSGATINNDHFKQFDNVDKLFGVIEKAIEREADKITVDYDKSLGYPTRIAIDSEELAVDDEITYTISSFTRL